MATGSPNTGEFVPGVALCNRPGSSSTAAIEIERMNLGVAYYDYK